MVSQSISATITKYSWLSNLQTTNVFFRVLEIGTSKIMAQEDSVETHFLPLRWNLDTVSTCGRKEEHYVLIWLNDGRKG
jgi:hypothetical protein